MKSNTLEPCASFLMVKAHIHHREFVIQHNPFLSLLPQSSDTLCFCLLNKQTNKQKAFMSYNFMVEVFSVLIWFHLLIFYLIILLFLRLFYPFFFIFCSFNYPHLIIIFLCISLKIHVCLVYIPCFIWLVDWLINILTVLLSLLLVTSQKVKSVSTK